MQLDTTQAAIDTIDYVATLRTGQAGDQTGLTSTTTRTVIIRPANDSTPPSVSTTTATSTAQ